MVLMYFTGFMPPILLGLTIFISSLNSLHANFMNVWHVCMCMWWGDVAKWFLVAVWKGSQWLPCCQPDKWAQLLSPGTPLAQEHVSDPWAWRDPLGLRRRSSHYSCCYSTCSGADLVHVLLSHLAPDSIVDHTPSGYQLLWQQKIMKYIICLPHSQGGSLPFAL